MEYARTLAAILELIALPLMIRYSGPYGMGGSEVVKYLLSSQIGPWTG